MWTLASLLLFLVHPVRKESVETAEGRVQPGVTTFQQGRRHPVLGGPWVPKAEGSA